METKIDLLSVLDPATSGELKDTPSQFDDFWGTIVGFDHQMGEDTDDDTGEKRFYLQAVCLITTDSGRDEYEKYPLPTNKSTGEPLMDENGKMARPNKNSKWGTQEGMYNAISVPWGGTRAGLIGLHAHFVRKGVRVTRADIAAGKRTERGAIPYGRYVVEWDGYNNEIRTQQGLNTISATPATNDVGKAGSKEVSKEQAIEEIILLANGKTFLDVLKETRKDEFAHLREFGSRDFLDGLVTEGKLGKDGTKYVAE